SKFRGNNWEILKGRGENLLDQLHIKYIDSLRGIPVGP
ncbi:hypothetical protein MTR67_014168, partial [Solanum verrucosum]